MVEAVLFDLDGTLADTAPDMARTVNLMRTSRGLAPVALEIVRPHVSNGARGMIGSAFGYTPEHPDYPSMREEFMALYADNLCVATRLFPGMAELLDALERQGIAWGVVSNKFERLTRAVLEGLGVAHRAGTIVGGDTCERPKPFPDPLLHAARAIRIDASRILYVGDDVRDVQAARAAGMGALVAGYGYVGVGEPPSAWGADGVVESASAIAAWIGLGRASPRPAL